MNCLKLCLWTIINPTYIVKLWSLLFTQLITVIFVRPNTFSTNVRFSFDLRRLSAHVIPLWCYEFFGHYSDVIMSRMGSQITSLMILYSTVNSGTDQRKHQRSASMAFVRGIPAQMASNTENVSIWWRHHMGKIFAVRRHNIYFLGGPAVMNCRCHIFYVC